MTTITFGPAGLVPPSASIASSEPTGSIPTLNWSAPWKSNALHGLDRLCDPTYGLPSGSAIASIMSTSSTAAIAIAERVVFALQLYNHTTMAPTTSVSLVGAGHLAQTILTLLPKSIGVRHSSRLPLATSSQAPRATNYSFSCDISSALLASPIAILTVPPHSLASLIELHAHAMQEAKLILVMCAGIAPLVVRRMFSGRGFADVGKRVVAVAPDDDVVLEVGRAVLGVLVGIDVYPPNWIMGEKKLKTAAVGDEQQISQRGRGNDEEEEATRKAWPGMSAGKVARSLLKNLVGDEYDPPLLDSKRAWDMELGTQTVQSAIRTVFDDKMKRERDEAV